MIRERPFAGTCYISGNEVEMAVACLHSQQWSSFKGGTEGWNLKECAEMSSKRAATFGPTDIRFLGGKYVRQMEALVAESCGVDFAVSANSATSALVMALGAINIEPGDEVLVPCLSFNASATAVLYNNAVPVFCEVKPETLCLDPRYLEERITPRTRAILLVHFGGNACDMGSIMEIARRHKLRVIEDCAQSPGVRYGGQAVGSIGDAGVFSFTETKNITCGEGGMVITNDPAIALKSRLIRNHGEGVTADDWTDEELANVVGMNFRLTELQAAVAIPQYHSLTERNEARNSNWQYLREGLASFGNCLVPLSVESGTDYACHIAYWHWRPGPGDPDRSTLVKQMNALGIPIGVAYGKLMHEIPLYSRRIAFGSRGCPWTCARPSVTALASYGTGACPISEAVNQSLVSFKFINPPNSKSDMDDVVRAFRQVLDASE